MHMTSRSISYCGCWASRRRPITTGGPGRRNPRGALARTPQLLAMIDEIRGSARVRRHLRLASSVAGAAQPRRQGRPQTRRADHARQRPPGRLPAQGLEARVDQAEPPAHRGAGPARARLHRDRAESEVGRRPDPHPHRRSDPVAGQRARCVRQQGGRLGFRPARDHRAGVVGAGLRDLVPRCPRRAADPSQRQGVSIHRGEVHPTTRRRRHRAVHRQRRG